MVTLNLHRDPRKPIEPGDVQTAGSVEEAKSLVDEYDEDILSADAAPELLAACKALLSFVEMHGDSKAKDYSRVCLDAGAAISKAQPV